MILLHETPWFVIFFKWVFVRFFAIIKGNLFFLLLVAALGAVGTGLLYSASPNIEDPWNPWALNHAIRLGFGMGVLIAIAIVPTRWLYNFAWPMFIVCLLALIAVELFGVMGLGAKRWLNLGGLHIQPSEFLKFAMILILARQLHDFPPVDRGAWFRLIPSLLIIVIPAILIIKQPDLGTGVIISLAALAMVFISGAPFAFFIFSAAAGLLMLPVIWLNLHSYQKDRLLIFLDPERDPLGKGYHIIQSKIAMGSGGVWGKGFLAGTQSQLDFLPEKHTDFIFTLLTEEWGFVGSLGLITLILLILFIALLTSIKVENAFPRYLAVGALSMFALHALVNIGMVSGLLPVVGLPLPLVSYGGSSMLAQMAIFGLIVNASLHRGVTLDEG